MTSERQRAILRTGWLAMTIPDKPQNSRQRYIITTETGKTENCFGCDRSEDRNYEI